MNKPGVKRLTAKEAGAIATRIMGPAGPLRMFSTTAFQGAIRYESRDWNGYAGQYVCESCLEPSHMGITRVGETWTCGACRLPKPLASPEVQERMRNAREARRDKGSGTIQASLALG